RDRMSIVPGLTMTVCAGRPYYRITSRNFRTKIASHHKKVVNGEGAVNSPTGGRYNHPAALVVYLAEEPRTCFAERMFYFHREVLPKLDLCHIPGAPPLPPFQQQY